MRTGTIIIMINIKNAAYSNNVRMSKNFRLYAGKSVESETTMV